MAVILVLLGSVLGFFGGLFAFFVVGSSFGVALAIWVFSGPVLALALIRPAAREGRTDNSGLARTA